MQDNKIRLAVAYYKRQQGEGSPCPDASGVTASKVQVRNANGDLLAEYDRNAEWLKNSAEKTNKIKQLAYAAIGIAVLASAFSLMSKNTTAPVGSIENKLAEPSSGGDINGEGGEIENSQRVFAPPGAVPANQANPCFEYQWGSSEHTSCMGRVGFVPLRILPGLVPQAYAIIDRRDSDGVFYRWLLMNDADSYSAYVDCSERRVYPVTFSGELIKLKNGGGFPEASVPSHVCRMMR